MENKVELLPFVEPQLTTVGLFALARAPTKPFLLTGITQGLNAIT